MTETLTPSVQDYVKHIYELTENGLAATTNRIAARLGVSPASVTGMLQRLASSRPALVSYKKHQGARLTRAGERAALEVIRHHRLLEAYLVEKLGYSWDEVHEEACRLEHVISEGLETRIAAALQHPSRDPHGALIPNEDLTMPSENVVPLSSLRAGESARVRRVADDDPALLRHLDEIGIVPGAKVAVEVHSEFDDNLTLRVEAGKAGVVLGTAVTARVFVEKKKRKPRGKRTD